MVWTYGIEEYSLDKFASWDALAIQPFEKYSFEKNMLKQNRSTNNLSSFFRFSKMEFKINSNNFSVHRRCGKPDVHVDKVLWAISI